MKRLIGLVAVLAVLAGGCSNPDEDADELRAFVRTSGREARTFTYQEASDERAFSVRGSVQDELRYSMDLSSGRTKVMEYIVRDDALAVRLNPSFATRIANVLGDPVVDKALKEGRWVIDPAGAPPLFESEVQAGGEVSGDPFRTARDALRFVQTSMGSARQIKEFTKDDVTYRSALDPWRYPPEESRREKRYDLLRPPLPVSEAQTLQGAGDIGPPQFRKTSVFVSGRRVREICSLVDVQRHEAFLELRRKGLGSNPFLARLLRRIEKKETSVPIVERYVYAKIGYPEKISVDAPADATTGKLETFVTALEGAFAAGLLRPRATPDTSSCRRVEEEDS
ncbi:MAG TPA: hypothetical protein VFA34_03905 [Actinomycetota bacterium]|jgi:hypothetical protein|nr:hypothetical protein [Actinomycetota bacterium]